MSAFASLDLPTLNAMRAETISALHELMTRATSTASRYGDSATFGQRREDLTAHLTDLNAAIAAKEGAPTRGPIYVVGGR